jgi:7-cyano-7-deazaguanine reductase
MSSHYDPLPLGKPTTYSDQYDASLLMPVARAQTRTFWPEEIALPFCGSDSWTGFELSWLNSKGKPQVASALLDYNALSKNIVESKSLKLYLNSFNQTVFENSAQMQQTIVRDVGTIVGDKVQVQLCSAANASALAIQPWSDFCIDDLDISITLYTTDAALLQTDTTQTEETLVSHLLRSNCPVTGQPDWASVRIHYCGGKISHASLLRYICSYRQHQGFHEQCIEQIFCDIWRECKPERLSIEGRFTRRGGLDINPFRASHADMHATQMRQVRQ